MKKMRLLETFSGNTVVNFNDGTTLCESGDSSLIDGQYIIGMVEGQFFQPDGMSRNKRWYSRTLWENVLKSADVKNRLMNHTMFGEIGHSDGPVTDMTLRKGEASHIITDLWIDSKGRGMGRAYILNTEAGRNLKIYLGATSKLKVSTRGEGVYLDGQFHDGCPVIDPDTYELQTVDFVLNPGFLETSANLTAQKESVEETQNTEQVNETIAHAKKEGETSMALDMDAYVAELKEELKALKAENKSLTEELKTKDKELLEKQFVESAEVKKISEEYEPFKKLGVSADSLSDIVKRSQKALKESKAQNAALIAEKAKISEELEAFKDKCGSIEQVDKSIKISENALNLIAEYKKLGSVDNIAKLIQESEKMVPQLEQLKELASYKELGSIEDIKTFKENCENVLPKLKDISLLEEYKNFGTVEEVTKLGEKTKVLVGKLQEAEILGKTVEKLIPQLDKMKQFQDYAKKANAVIEKYVATVGNLQEARKLAESKVEVVKKVNVKEAMEVSKQFGCTVESAAKMLKKYGKEETTKLLEAEVAKRQKPETKKLAESKELVEEAAQMDKVNAKPEEKEAKDFLKSGMIANAFNHEALGKKIDLAELNKLDGDKVEGLNKAKQLLNKLKGITAEVAEAPKVEEPKTAAQAEKEANKVLDK